KCSSASCFGGHQLHISTKNQIYQPKKIFFNQITNLSTENPVYRLNHSKISEDSPVQSQIYRSNVTDFFQLFQCLQFFLFFLFINGEDHDRVTTDIGAVNLHRGNVDITVGQETAHFSDYTWQVV